MNIWLTVTNVLPAQAVYQRQCAQQLLQSLPLDAESTLDAFATFPWTGLKQFKQLRVRLSQCCTLHKHIPSLSDRLRCRDDVKVQGAQERRVRSLRSDAPPTL